MQLSQLLVRFYKSFNYDYERKANPNAEARPWELTDEGWFPHVTVDLEPDVTAVVGANESGKSHLLDVVEILLSGENQDQRDFCRYSSLFSVELGMRRYPEFGGLFQTTTEERAQLAAAAVPVRSDGAVLLVRPKPNEWKAVDSKGILVDLDIGAVAQVISMLPAHFRLETQVPLPDSVSIRVLAGRGPREIGRRKRRSVLDVLTGADSAATIQSASVSLFSEVANEEASESAEQELGRLLLTKVAKIDPSAFAELEEAIREEREGLVNGLIQKMNESLARHLSLSRWWTQDTEFTLRVSPREHELVFTIRDQTGTDYSFGERSTGLRYFLSYFVQLRAHDRPIDRSEILLMDEPDTYLSASGQQDLLRVLEHHARPDGLDCDDKVIYVTHSPFLINRNAGHRIRVLDKGTGEEGTRLVKDATRNRYEPLRSAIGAYVAETAFIGGANLFVEGISDQVLLAGLSNRLRLSGRPDSQCLNLNEVTIVAAGSAPSIPYMLYLARGQDEVKPPCAVLLDSDQSGQDALRQIRKGGAYGKRLVPDEHVMMLGEWAAGQELQLADGVAVTEIEDLIPTNVAFAAARAYAIHFIGKTVDEADTLTAQSIAGRIDDHNGSLFDALSDAFETTFDATIEKIGFAKEVVKFLDEATRGKRPDGVPALEANFGALIEALAELLLRVSGDEAAKRQDKRLGRILKAFAGDYPDGCTRDRANVALKEIEAISGDTERGDELRAVVSGIRRDFRLTAEPMAAVQNFKVFLERVSNLKYVERLSNQGVLTEAPPPLPPRKKAPARVARAGH
jgi:predicted ATPase